MKRYELTRKRTLVVAPLAVATNTWPDELTRWEQFTGLKFAVLHGEGKKDFIPDKDIDIINPEGLTWLFKTMAQNFRVFPYDNIVIDESTLFKNVDSLRFQILDFYLHRFPRRALLTGTPIPNSLLDIFGQMMLIDRGESLGSKLTAFKRKYFYQVGVPEHDRWEAYDTSLKRVEKRIAPVVCRVDARDYKTFPPLKFNDIFVRLPPKIQKIYDEIERDLFTCIDGDDIRSQSESSKYNALRQIAAGGLYKPLEWFEIPTKDRVIYALHTAKLAMIKHIVSELRGKPLLVGYHYKFVPKHITENNAVRDVSFINGGTRATDDKTTIQAWNADMIPVLFGQPGSMGHGLNLHYGTGRTIAWFNLPDVFEQYDQFNRRIFGRNGVTEPVTVHNIIAVDTIEEVILDRLRKKETTQKSLLDGLNRYKRRKYK
jgi:SNF2 family DNA or RNA helicase